MEAIKTPQFGEVILKGCKRRLQEIFVGSLCVSYQT
jgi:hypothetical protein